jgi:hypothetical protein
MARSKPNKSLKSPHKQQLEEINNQDKTENPPNITPQTTNTNKTETGTEERSVERNITHNKYVRNPENIPYYEGDTLDRRIYQQDRNTQQLNEEGDLVKSSDDEFIQPSDEDSQGNFLTEEELTSKRMGDVHRTPSTEDSKPAAKPENEDSSPSPEQHPERLNKRDHELESINKLFANWAKNTQKQLKEQGENTQWKLRPCKEQIWTRRIL